MCEVRDAGRLADPLAGRCPPECGLTALSKNPRLSPPNREAVFIRLTDVQRITRALEEEGTA